MKRHTSLVAGLVAVAMVSMTLGGIVPAFGLAAPVFGAASSVQGTGAPRDVALADFNQDGYDDVVAAIVSSDAEPFGVSLSFGGQDPVLGTPQMVEVGAPTWSVLTADFDADGDMDIVASLAEGNGIALLSGLGDGTFAAPVIYAAGNAVRGLAIADLNEDGWLDIVGTEPESPGLVVLTGAADGFAVSEYGLPIGYALEAAVGQLAGDELPDVAVVDNFGAQLVVLENTGAGFSVAQTLEVGAQPRDVVVADFNGDSVDDIAASSSIASDIEVFLANDSHVYSSALVVAAGEGVRTGAMMTRDLDIDGDIDLLAANAYTGAIVALENDGSGHLAVIETFPVASGPTAIAMGDPDQDRVADVVIADFGDACVRVIASPQTLIQVPDVYRLPPEPEPEPVPVPAPVTLAMIEVAGLTRYETAVAASQLAFPDGTPHVVVASGENWPDAVTASALAGRLDAPLLLTRRAALPAAVAAEIKRLGAADAIVIGGVAAVSPDVADSLDALVGDVRRLAGADRYATADAVAREVIELAGGTFDGRAFVATGRVFADALAVSPLANAAGSPVYLTPPAGRANLDDEMVAGGVTDIVILGGAAAVDAAVEIGLASSFGAVHVGRIEGADRYETAAAVAQYGVTNEGLSWDGVGLATGTDFPDALAGGSMLGSRGSVMLLTPPDRLAPAAEKALTDHADDVNTIVFLGSFRAIDLLTRTAAANSLR